MKFKRKYQQSNLYFFVLLLVEMTSIQASPLTISLSHTNVSCLGSRDGSITAICNDGVAPYTYIWSNEANTSTISNLSGGFYRVIVIDANNNTGDAEITLIEPEKLVTTISTPTYPNGYNVTCRFCYDGIVNTSVEGGVPPYSYFFSDGVVTSNRTDMRAGNFQLLITDANGCSNMHSFGLSAPDRDDWQTSGNSGSDPSNQYIGTNDSKDFVIKSNANERLRIKANGDLKLSNLPVGVGMLYVDSIGTIKSGRTIAPCNGAIAPIWQSFSQNQIFTCSPNVVGIGTFNIPTGMRLSVEGNSYFNGKVGIGNAINPAAKLEVEDNAINEVEICVYNSKTSLGGLHNANIWVKNHHFSYGFGIDNIDIGHIYSNVNASPSQSILAFNGNGEMGIGTNPQSGYKLVIDGNLGAREIRVTANGQWPDYVFNKDYKLRTLEEVNYYITKYKHLPDMPAASDIDEKGLLLGEIQRLHQQKIEELTLYNIQLNEIMKKVILKNEQLEKRVNELENR